jgi:phenylalanyl-tRNA synthetase alpha chain
MGEPTPLEEIERITSGGAERAEAATSVEELAALDVELLGKRSRLGELRAALKDLGPEERKELGQALHAARSRLEELIGQRRTVLSDAARLAALRAERQDLTEALGRARIGHLHPITQTWQRLEDVFVGMGFTVEDGPEVETDWFNFEALNLPPAHPARSLWDTLYLDTAGDEGVGS